MNHLLITFLMGITSMVCWANSSDLPQVVTKSLSQAHLKNTDYAFEILNLKTLKPIVQVNNQSAMIAASLTKLLSLNFALEILGADYRFQTHLFHTGNIVGNQLEGDLILQGGGDPYLSVSDLMSLIMSLKKAGIEKVKGHFYFDSQAYPFTNKIGNIGLEDQTDNPSLSALNIEFNRFKVYNRKVIPTLSGLEVKKGTLFPAGQKFSLKKSTKDQEIWFYNPSSIKRFEEVPSRNSNLLCTSYFRFLGKLQGITLAKAIALPLSYREKKILLATHSSLSLYKLAALAFEYSNNLFAEIPMITAVQKEVGPQSNLKNYAQIMMKWYKNKYPQLPWKQLYLENGSGISVQNKISPKLLNLLLAQFSKQNYQNKSYWSLLSIAGHSGQLSRRFRNEKQAFRIWGKTGSLHYVNNLGGYIFGKSGKKYAFSFFITGQGKRKILNNPVTSKAQQLRRQHSRWRSRSITAMDKILSYYQEHI